MAMGMAGSQCKWSKGGKNGAGARLKSRGGGRARAPVLSGAPLRGLGRRGGDRRRRRLGSDAFRDLRANGAGTKSQQGCSSTWRRRAVAEQAATQLLGVQAWRGFAGDRRPD